jgi:stress-induced morphogen
MCASTICAATATITPAMWSRPCIQQHQMVYAALKGRMGGELHAMALQTALPAGA